jgi:predicted O-methyltransferase YrrM
MNTANITKDAISRIQFDKFSEIIQLSLPHDKDEFMDVAGKQHYRLLAYLSTLVNDSIIVDIGTHRGNSALALSYNTTNTVHTFDIVDNVNNGQIRMLKNVMFHIENLFDSDVRETWEETLLQSAFIFLDVDPHNGIMEMEMYHYLKHKQYKGFVVCDDIWYFKDMKDKFWNQIPFAEKYDLTHLGHSSGTGVFSFNMSFAPPDTMILAKNDLNQMNVSKYPIHDFFGSAGEQPYRLLTHLSSKVKGDVIVFGAFDPLSTLSLSFHNQVHVFNAFKRVLWPEQPVIYHDEHIIEARDKYRTMLLAAPLILLNYETPTFEIWFYHWLKREGYQGLLLCNGIWKSKERRDKFWYHVPESEKTDVTLVGDATGTGIIHLQNQRFQVVEAPIRGNKKGEWTVVTAYFNLTKCPDASPEINSRPQSYYMQHANMTMALPVNLVVFCDSDSQNTLESMRPAHLNSQTHWIVMEFADFDVVKKYHKFITASRASRGYNADPRNTVSYYLFCITRYVMLQRAMQENIFASTHFAWVNICIERMSWKSGVIFPMIWTECREKFSTCYIDYQSKKWKDNLGQYYQFGRCSMCSGFFTGSLEYMTLFCDALMSKFYEMTALGLGHADEQLFSLVYFDQPDIFDFYLGDYTEMIVNYGWVRDRASEPVRNVIGNLAISGENWPLLSTLCKRWLDSVYHGTCFPPEGEIRHVIVLQNLAHNNMR